MALQLNDPRIEYQEFFGRYNEQMPRLISEGRVPMSVADIMRRRLEVANSNDPTLRAAWHDNYVDTSDAVVYHPNGNIKIVLEAQPLRDLTQQNLLRTGALLIDDDLYDRLDGPAFSRDNLPSGRSLTQQEVLTHPVWNAVARNDKALLREYTSLVLGEAKQRFGYEENMGVYLHPTPRTPALRAWGVDRIYKRSDLDGNLDLGIIYARLVGVARATKVPQ